MFERKTLHNEIKPSKTTLSNKKSIEDFYPIQTMNRTNTCLNFTTPSFFITQNPNKTSKDFRLHSSKDHKRRTHQQRLYQILKKKKIDIKK